MHRATSILGYELLNLIDAQNIYLEPQVAYYNDFQIEVRYLGMDWYDVWIFYVRPGRPHTKVQISEHNKMSMFEQHDIKDEYEVVKSVSDMWQSRYYEQMTLQEFFDKVKP